MSHNMFAKTTTNEDDDEASCQTSAETVVATNIRRVMLSPGGKFSNVGMEQEAGFDELVRRVAAEFLWIGSLYLISADNKMSLYHRLRYSISIFQLAIVGNTFRREERREFIHQQIILWGNDSVQALQGDLMPRVMTILDNSKLRQNLSELLEFLVSLPDPPVPTTAGNRDSLSSVTNEGPTGDVRPLPRGHDAIENNMAALDLAGVPSDGSLSTSTAGLALSAEETPPQAENQEWPVYVPDQQPADDADVPPESESGRAMSRFLAGTIDAAGEERDKQRQFVLDGLASNVELMRSLFIRPEDCVNGDAGSQGALEGHVHDGELVEDDDTGDNNDA